MSSSKYCRLCKAPCDDCSVCLRNPDRFKPSPDMIKTALEKKGAFTSSAFQTISKDPPKISVTDRADGGSEVSVRLTSMSFIPQYRDPGTPERKRLEKAAREEIIRSFKLPRAKVGDGDIKIDIREGSLIIYAVLCASILVNAAIEIAGICNIKTTEAEKKPSYDTGRSAGATGASFRANGSCGTGYAYVPVDRYTARDQAKDVKKAGSKATGAILGATAGAAAGPLGMAIGGAVGFIGGALFGDAWF